MTHFYIKIFFFSFEFKKGKKNVMHAIYDISLTTNKTRKTQNQLNSNFSVILFKYKMCLPLTRVTQIKDNDLTNNGKSF